MFDKMGKWLCLNTPALHNSHYRLLSHPSVFHFITA
jgi:hypothetical protein